MIIFPFLGHTRIFNVQLPPHNFKTRQFIWSIVTRRWIGGKSSDAVTSKHTQVIIYLYCVWDRRRKVHLKEDFYPYMDEHYNFYSNITQLQRVLLNLFLYTIITARKRSLGQGNIFSSMCQEICSRGLPQCMLGYHPPQSRHPPAQCMLGDTVNKRAVCILLECNLVSSEAFRTAVNLIFI